MATIQAKKRKDDEIGKKYASIIRREGFVPASIYGGEGNAINISLDPVAYVKHLNNSDYKKNVIFEIVIDDTTTERVITKEVVVNPINNQFTHIDFIRVSEKEKINVFVPIQVSGISAGQRLGGVLVVQNKRVKVRCLPGDIPVSIAIDVTKLSIGENIRTKELLLNDNVELISNPNEIVLKVESTKVSKAAAGNEAGQVDSEAS